MLRKWRKGIAFVLFMALSLGVKTTALAAAPEAIPEDTVVINLFDPDDPNLVEIVDAPATVRTTSRPTQVWNLNTQGRYSYSAYSNNNIMWSKYIFFSGSNLGWFEIKANSTNTNYRLLVYDAESNKEYKYNILSTNVLCLTRNLPGWGNPDSFYFGIDTTITKSAVSVNGYVDLE